MSVLKGTAMVEAIIALRPNCTWSITGDEQLFSDLVWDESNEVAPPTEEEVAAKTEEIRAERLATAYQRKRKKEYNKLNQFELMFNDKINGTTTWQEAINNIKLRFPKPTE